MKKKFLVLFMLLSSLCYAKPKIYDCFLFYNELEILDIRLNELYEHVDKFVLVEAIETFRGNPKPLYFEQNLKRYERFLDKIIHVIVNDRMKTTNPWDRETFQRNQIMRGLYECQSNDMVLISDVDEIIRATMIPKILKTIYQERQYPIVCEQTLFRYYLNIEDISCVRDSSRQWAGTCATRFEQLNKTTPTSLRLDREYGSRFVYPIIHNAGWHFTTMGGVMRVAQKYEAFSHQEYDTTENKSREAMLRYMHKNCKLVPIDDSFPKYILDNFSFLNENGFFYAESLFK